MRYMKSLDQLAAECEERARQVASDGDRAQLTQIAMQLREMENRDGQRPRPRLRLLNEKRKPGMSL